MRKNRAATGQHVNLTSLVDVVSMNVGILVILAVFMALLAVFSSAQHPGEAGQTGRASTATGAAAEGTTAGQAGTEQPVERLSIPWAHPTNKQTIFFAIHGGRVQYLDMKVVYEQLLAKAPGGREATPSLDIPGVKTRFFPVTNQVYCLEFRPDASAGEQWDHAKRAGYPLQRLLSAYPSADFVYFFWVAGDSFEVFRDVRKSLIDRQFEVGWKPVAKDAPLEVCNGFEGSNTCQPQ